jgi:hypothetical protein
MSALDGQPAQNRASASHRRARRSQEPDTMALPPATRGMLLAAHNVGMGARGVRLPANPSGGADRVAIGLALDAIVPGWRRPDKRSGRTR